jgi:glycosyltransferase involved in cell wall biosynthesis
MEEFMCKAKGLEDVRGVSGSGKPTISVCIPVYNGERYISECVDSVLHQTMDDFELVIVDNCSTDRTYCIASAYSDPRIRVFRNPRNIGSLKNFNRCVELAEGEFFVLLPHDDVLIPTMLETLGEALSANVEVGLAYSSYNIIDADSSEVGTRIVSADDKVMSGDEAIREFITHGNPVQCAMVRRELFSIIGSFDEDQLVMTDIDMWCRVALRGYKVAYFSIPQNCFRIRADSGQQAFLLADERNIGSLSDHLGFAPSLDFVRQNTYYELAFRYLQALFNEIPQASMLQKWRPLAARQWIVGALLRHLGVSLYRRRWTWVGDDMKLLLKVFKWAGALGMMLALLQMSSEFVVRRMKSLGR